MILSHFATMVLYSAAVALAFAFLSKEQARERLQYFVLAFVAFILVAVGIGWLMYPFSH